MDRYRVNVLQEDRENGSRQRHRWWLNFERANPDWYKDIEGSDELNKYNGYNIQRTSFIEFDTEADFLVFKLMFS